MKAIKLFMLPTIIALMLIGVYPFIYCLYISFYRTSLVMSGGERFVGLGNYITLLQGGPENLFYKIFGLSFAFALSSTFVCLLVGLALALLLDQQFAGRGIFRTILILPMATTPAVVGLMWRMNYDVNFGFINYFISSLGMKPYAFLADETTVLPALILVDVWEWSPLVMLILLAGLQSLPSEPFEAAKIDGASSWQTFRYLTLPMLKSAIIVALLIRTVDSFKTFDIVFVSTKGGPGTASELASLWAYDLAFAPASIGAIRMGYAAAFAIIFLNVISLVCTLYYRNLRRV